MSDCDTYLLNLATSLTNRTLQLAEIGRRREAMPVSEEALRLYRELARLNRDAYLPSSEVAVLGV